MSKTLLPSNESEELQDMDITYREALPDHSDIIDYAPSSCSVKMLPFLATAYNIPYWEIAWREDIKRQLIAEARELHKRAGTPWSIRRVLEILGLSTAEGEAIIIEGGLQENYKWEIRRDGTYPYSSEIQHNSGEYLYNLRGLKWWEFVVVVKITASYRFLRFAAQMIRQFKPVHTELVGIIYNEAPAHDGRIQYNSEYIHSIMIEGARYGSGE